MKFIPHIYTIKTITNLHVGGSGHNFDIVDNQVQRDPTTSYPTIFSSSIKGALRDHFVESGEDTSLVEHVFGSEPGDSKAKQGKYRFLSADILALPQSGTSKAFELISTNEIQNAIKTKMSLLGRNITDNFHDLKISSDEFSEISNELPVLARNYLKNGESQNLWYEEIVPRESLFTFVVLVPDNDSHFESFNEKLNDKVVQIGANATIGYGLCHFTKIN